LEVATITALKTTKSDEWPHFMNWKSKHKDYNLTKEREVYTEIIKDVIEQTPITNL